MKNSKSLPLLLVLTAGLTLNSLAQTPPAAAPAAPATPAATITTLDPGTVRSAIDLVRADIKHEKALIIAQNMTFTEDESAEFWPLYNEYNADLLRLLDLRLAVLKEYVAAHDSMTNEQATALAGKVFDLEGKRLELRRAWFKKFSETIPAKKTAQFFQIEGQINAALDLIMMDSLPLIK